MVFLNALVQEPRISFVQVQQCKEDYCDVWFTLCHEYSHFDVG